MVVSSLAHAYCARKMASGFTRHRNLSGLWFSNVFKVRLSWRQCYPSVITLTSSGQWAHQDNIHPTCCVFLSQGVGPGPIREKRDFVVDVIFVRLGIKRNPGMKSSSVEPWGNSSWMDGKHMCIWISYVNSTYGPSNPWNAISWNWVVTGWPWLFDLYWRLYQWYKNNKFHWEAL